MKFNFRTDKNPNFETIYLKFYPMAFLAGNECWSCEIWQNNWINTLDDNFKDFAHGYGKNKFEAVRSAIKNLNN